MKRLKENEEVVAEINLTGCPEGAVLRPLEPPGEVERKHFAGWETPLAPWGGFRLLSLLQVVRDGDRPVLEWDTPGEKANNERALVTRKADLRDGRTVAEVQCLDEKAGPNVDRNDRTEALVGIVFRCRTSRHYYQFGIEGRRRAVLYRRSDAEWFVLAEAQVVVPQGFVTLEVRLDGDGIRCTCKELGVDFFNTDTLYREGKVGLRSVGKARMAGFRVFQSRSQKRRDALRSEVRSAEEAGLGSDLPDAKLVCTLDLKELGGDPTFHDFVKPDCYDMLVAGERARAVTADGELLWELPFPVRNVTFSSEHTEKGRLIYGFTGQRATKEGVSVTGLKFTQTVSDEMVVIRGGDGQVLARARVPDLAADARFPDFSPTTANLAGNGPFDIVLREWRESLGGGGANLWAYDRELKPIWHRTVHEAPYGHHWALRFLDIDQDGKDELLAGGTMFNGAGDVLWVHDREPEMARIFGAHHYDAVALSRFADDEAVDPVAFLLGGSAGVYVVDALTGETRMVHRTGHAQGVAFGKVRNDLPGEQVLVVMRWGNMGILTLFSGHGDRLWTIQPDYSGQGAVPVTWGRRTEQLIWTNTSAAAQALYDGYGRRVKELPALRQAFGDRMRKDVGTVVARLGTEPTEYLCLTTEGTLQIFGPASR
jgi:hypothetical protein